MIFYGKKNLMNSTKNTTNKWACQNFRIMDLGLLAQSCNFGDPETETEELQAQWPSGLQRGFKARTDNLMNICLKRETKERLKI